MVQLTSSTEISRSDIYVRARLSVCVYVCSVCVRVCVVCVCAQIYINHLLCHASLGVKFCSHHGPDGIDAVVLVTSLE